LIFVFSRSYDAPIQRMPMSSDIRTRAASRTPWRPQVKAKTTTNAVPRKLGDQRFT
jgi:hypothetical protein